jgi:hypothetical protein
MTSDLFLALELAPWILGGAVILAFLALAIRRANSRF